MFWPLCWLTHWPVYLPQVLTHRHQVILWLAQWDARKVSKKVKWHFTHHTHLLASSQLNTHLSSLLLTSSSIYLCLTLFPSSHIYSVFLSSPPSCSICSFLQNVWKGVTDKERNWQRERERERERLNWDRDRGKTERLNCDWKWKWREKKTGRERGWEGKRYDDETDTNLKSAN